MDLQYPEGPTLAELVSRLDKRISDLEESLQKLSKKK